MQRLKLISLLAVIFFITSCSITKKLEKSVIGKWQIVMLEDELNKESNEDYKKVLKELLKDSYFEFKGDKTYEILMTGKKNKGNWSISDDGSKILTSVDNIHFEIFNQSEGEMKLKYIKDSKSVIMSLKKI